MMNHKKKNTQVEIPPISEPLRDPKYVAPIANGLPHSGPFWTSLRTTGFPESASAQTPRTCWPILWGAGPGGL